MTFFVFIGKTTYWRSKKYQFCDGIYLNNISNNQSMPNPRWRGSVTRANISIHIANNKVTYE